GERGVMAKFIYNQGANQLSVSLISPSQHFALWEDTPYGHAVSMGKLKPSKLPFATESDKKVTYKISSGFKSTVKNSLASKGKLIMQRTIATQGAEPVELPITINNNIEQVDYTLSSPADTVRVDLGGLIIMELKSEKKSGKRKYNLVAYRDINRGYRVNIVRDQCLGREADIELARSRSEAVRTALESLKVVRDDALVANTKEKQEMFEKMKDLSVKSYVRNDSVDLCNQINEINDGYNKYVDSLANMKLEVTKRSNVVDAKYLMSQTQKIDGYMATIQFSRDSAERDDAKNWCSQVIREVNDHINQSEVVTREGREAINIFYRAESTYYKITSK
ncbi:MAG: hypothetical protein SNG35_00965, partial [Rikenellaceae bacterium]